MPSAAPPPLSFNCVICFDTFDHDERPPVILPCGHTYVCEPCSKRLERCMECRASLYTTTTITPPACPNSGCSGQSHGHSVMLTPSRYQMGDRPVYPTQQYPSTPKKPITERTPLPTPKNLVLMSFMEFAKRGKYVNTKDDDDETSDDSSLDSDDMLKCALEGFSESHGTYAVMEPKGLSVTPHQPQDDCDDENKEEDDNDLWNEEEGVFIDEGTDEGTAVEDVLACSSHVENSLHSTRHLKHGETVQIVDFLNGVAELARGQGFIVASCTQLVKVGPPTDEACRVGGLLRLAQVEEKKRREKWDWVCKKSESLKNELDVLLACDVNENGDIPIVEEKDTESTSDDDDEEVKEVVEDQEIYDVSIGEAEVVDDESSIVYEVDDGEQEVLCHIYPSHLHCFVFPPDVSLIQMLASSFSFGEESHVPTKDIIRNVPNEEGMGLETTISTRGQEEISDSPRGVSTQLFNCDHYLSSLAEEEQQLTSRLNSMKSLDSDEKENGDGVLDLPELYDNRCVSFDFPTSTSETSTKSVTSFLSPSSILAPRDAGWLPTSSTTSNSSSSRPSPNVNRIYNNNNRPDFRTGMSGHRALSSVKTHSPVGLQ